MTADGRGDWLGLLRWYLPLIVAANLLWEAVHLPLYTVWAQGPPGYLLFVVVHCTAGDALIALVALSLALLVSAPSAWPHEGFWRVLAIATLAGAGYTVFSEWLNIVVRKSWAYSDLMPVVPLIDAGLSPLLQWLIIPPAALLAARTFGVSKRTE